MMLLVVHTMLSDGPIMLSEDPTIHQALRGVPTPYHTHRGPYHALKGLSHALRGFYHALIGPYHALRGLCHAVRGFYDTLIDPYHAIRGPCRALSESVRGRDHTMVSEGPT